ncbi:ATP-binding protein [Streptomyces sp. SID5910]|uniref:ATP-binding protein n=1 Tax=Streptomyces sp. SID5910 TaxID=2690312 RepID=UPI00136D900A|nr:ATP-binding protein [Streptomyces sp. SID5910]MYR40480.1 ATP-binding protein [Streptomyces sp. SID5910]
MGDVLRGRRDVGEDGRPVVSATFPRDAASVPAARRLVRAAVDEWGLSGLADVADSITSELATNAVLHACRESFRVTARRLSDEQLQVSVTDLSRNLPKVAEADDDWENGRGLLLVDALAQKWGAEPLRWGKRVWADLAVPPSPEPPVREIPIYSSHRAQVVYVMALLAVATTVIVGLTAQR